MVRTRRSSSHERPPSPQAEADEENQLSSSEPDEEPPKPVSSSSSDDDNASEDDDASMTTPAPDAASLSKSSSLQGMSRLFSPYRTLGIVSSGAPYHLQSHAEAATLVALPIGERFHIVNTDRLQPVLVSQAVDSNISHLISDASLGISVAVHGSTNLSLFARTKPLHTLPLVDKRRTRSQHWKTVNMLDLGKIKVAMSGEKEGKLENALVVAIILAKESEEDNASGIPTVGDDDHESDGDSSDDDESTAESDSPGQVILVVATRSSVEIQKRIRLPIQPTMALHPSTYLNKIIVGGTNSSLLLLNVRSSKIIHKFSCLPESSTIPTNITALEQSPAVDTVAVGMSNGMVHLINLRHDKTLFSLQHRSKSNKPVQITSLSFRTDGSAMRYGIAPLAVGRDDGTVSIWDLTPQEDPTLGRTLLCEMDRVHSGGVAKITYLPQEPVLLSIGTTSNSILMHIFDSPDHSARLLRQRTGHVAPPKRIRYLHPAHEGVLANTADGTDASSCQILSSGGADRTLRLFSTARSVLDKQYSQGKGLEKRARKLGLDSTAELLLPPLTGMATSESRSRDWGDLVTIHRHHAFAYVWSTKRGAQSGPLLRQPKWNVSAMQVPPPRSCHATSVAMSSCGNFAIVGTAGGTIYKYNVQSGIPRGSYPKSATTKEDQKRKKRTPGDVSRTINALEKAMKVSNRPSDLDKEERDAVQEAAKEQRRLAKLAIASHSEATVTGLAVDSTNKTLISVGADAKLILWNFATHAPHKKSPYKLPAPATKLCHIRDSDLAAIAMEDFSIVLFDCAALSIVRRFGVGEETVCHTGPISDLGFTPDGRHLFSSSMDGTIRVWDVPTNTCVDWLSFHSPPTSLTVSPTGEFLATTHVNKVGISMWSDRSFYQTVHMDGAHPPTEPAKMDDPAPVAEIGDAAENADFSAGRPSFENQIINAAGNEGVETDSSVLPVPKEDGLITLSGLPPAHWKNLFHLELVKERNKPKEAPKKPPSAPFFLQWRGGETLDGGMPSNTELQASTENKEGAAEEEWDAVWSDDDDSKPVLAIDSSDNKRALELDSSRTSIVSQPKKRKVTHHRSHLAALLEECSHTQASQGKFQAVTDHVTTLGPSAIDVSLTTLCSGMHDLEDGLPLLHLAALWLLEACESRQRYEAVNAYLHRFLYLHANVLAGIDDSIKDDAEKELTEEEIEELSRQKQQRLELLETISKLKQAQQSASNGLRGKMQHTLCLLRHFSRMV